MNSLIKISLGAVLTALLMMMHVLLLSDLWSWFLVPLGFPEAPWWNVWGIGIMLGYLTYTRTESAGYEDMLISGFLRVSMVWIFARLIATYGPVFT